MPEEIAADTALLIIRERIQLKEVLRLAEVGQLAAGIGHEFNNLLTALVGYFELWRGDICEGKPDITKKFAGILDSTLPQMVELSTGLLGYSRESNPGLYDISKSIDRALALARPAQRRFGIEVETDYGPKINTHLKSSPEQVFLNIIINAYHAMKDKKGEKKLRIRTRTQEGVYNVIDVMFKDTGHGISEQDQKRIFDPFYTTKKVGEGTGLGLSLVRQFVEDNNGIIEVKSDPGKGTTFTLKFYRGERHG